MGGRRIFAWLAIAAMSLAGPAAAAHANDARIVGEKRIGPRVIELTIATPAFTEPTHVDVDLPAGGLRARRQDERAGRAETGAMTSSLAGRPVTD